MYLALYRKYRPQTFDDVVSQKHITKTLKNQIVSGKTAHAYLFTGSRGTGKTSCAKIFAKAINCLNPHDGEPCLECAVCRGIEDGSVTDVVEIDAASNNGVENIRELRETAFFTPTFAKYRVYIIDEVHMLSVPAFNALLKIMEEPPAHVKFVLATTEVHKVPITVISRCQRFDFKRIKDEDIANRLKYIAKKENVRIEDDAAQLIARLGDGALRDGISLLDRILSATDEVTLEAVENSVGVAGSDYLFELADCIFENNSVAALAAVDELYMGSKDLQRLCGELINHFRNLMLIKATNGDCGELVKASAKDYKRLSEQQDKCTMGQILNCLTRLQECYDKIGKSSGKRIEFEMCMIRLCTPKSEKAVQKSEGVSVKESEKPFEIPKLRRDMSAVTEPPKSETETAQEKYDKREETEQQAEKQIVIPKLPKNEVKTEPQVKIPKETAAKTPLPYEPLPDPVPAPQTENEPPNVEPEKKSESASGGNFVEVTEWEQVVDVLIGIAPHLVMMKNGSKAFVKGDNIYIGVSSPLMNAQLKRDGNTVYLQQAIRKVLGRDYKIKLKADSGRKTEEKKPVDTFIANARTLGIEIEEE